MNPIFTNKDAEFFRSVIEDAEEQDKIKEVLYNDGDVIRTVEVKKGIFIRMVRHIDEMYIIEKIISDKYHHDGFKGFENHYYIKDIIYLRTNGAWDEAERSFNKVVYNWRI